jgi:hypothetical protein
MIDQTMPSPVSEPQRSSPLQLPLQAAPIDRAQSPTSALASDGGVEAAFSWTDLIPIATSALGALSDRRLKRDLLPVEWSR